MHLKFIRTGYVLLFRLFLLFPRVLLYASCRHEILSDYLSGIDQGIENCRDLLSTGGLQIDPDTMKELFSICEQAPVELEVSCCF